MTTTQADLVNNIATALGLAESETGMIRDIATMFELAIAHQLVNCAAYVDLEHLGRFTSRRGAITFTPSEFLQALLTTGQALRKEVGARIQKDIDDDDDSAQNSLQHAPDTRRRDMIEEMDKYGVDENQDDEQLEKRANQGCPKCGGALERHGTTLLCPRCGSEPFEKGGKQG